MKFLVVTKAKSSFPIEMGLALTQASEEWARKYTASGKIEQIWNFAGLQGGSGIANVDSLEEFQAIMAEFPMASFSDIEIYGLTDFFAGTEAWKKAMQAMAH